MRSAEPYLASGLIGTDSAGDLGYFTLPFMKSEANGLGICKPLKRTSLNYPSWQLHYTHGDYMPQEKENAPKRTESLLTA